MQKLSDRQRFLFGEKAIDLANIAAGALIFGTFLSGAKLQWGVAMGAGAALYLILISIALKFTKE